MKCEKCNKNEATFYYSCNINGNASQRHLCADCAREEGFGGAMDFRPGGMLDDVFQDVFSDFFSPARSVFPSFGSFGVPMRSIMAPSAPLVNIVIGDDKPRVQPLEESEVKIPSDAGDEVKGRRRLSELKHRMKEAVKAEDFETAAQLRDEIKKLEA